ncbi:DNA polymerase I [Synechococcus sp. PCC 6312]|uniref:DNA polymerase I n=1 Tax=Synechococcus sp. (strain ATCC 27167 / PCC 6312) TaxID=195253 RepID=UPI00029F2136|nr:DNA polymerase I [Synechococcus sp. PCC 6312]AFY62609.1 DNA polymerase I family protein with 3'-5'-exonuclease and polymerase domains [Synechococcus sp. PCC 6312]
MTRPNSTLLLVDGHSLAFRSYYAFAKGRDGGLRTSTGIPTSITFGFLKTLLEVIQAEQTDHLAVAFDLGGPTFRHEADSTYKEGRPETPDDFAPDLENLQLLLQALSVPILISPGYEADDVIGTIAQQASQAGLKVKIVSGDQDLFQLIDPEKGISVLHLSSAFAKSTTAAKEFGPEEVKSKLGVWPRQVVDYKALCGDTSDNIPGVRGIGPKTAVQLIEQFETLDNIYAHLDQIKGATQKKLKEGLESARHSQFMAQIALNVPIEVSLEQLVLGDFDWHTLDPLLAKLEFKAIKTSLLQLHTQLGGAQLAAETLSQDEDWFFSANDTENAQPPHLDVQIINSPAKLDQLIETLKQQTDPNKPVAWDTETTSLSPRDAQLVGIGCCWGPGLDQMAYLPLGHRTGQNLELSVTLEKLQPILRDPNYPKVLQNAKYDRLVLQFQGLELTGVVFDPMLASYVINPEGSHNLTDISSRYLPIRALTYGELVSKGQSLADVSISEVAQYCGLDVYTTYLLVDPLRQELSQTPKLLELLEQVELPLEPVLAAMETVGIRIDVDYLKQLSEQLNHQLNQLETQAYELAGFDFNLGSPKQLSQLLFHTLGLDIKKTRKTKLGYSTDAATLEKLQGDHPIIDLILEHRTLAKLKSTYVDALPELVRPDTQRVHTDFNQAITATGRLSSSNPNLQNIPIRTEFSRQIRAAFIPEPDWILISADYSQIELRILAHLSQEPRLITAYQNRQDVHTLTAQLLLDKTEINSEERRLAKIINFGVIYGMGAQRFSREAGVNLANAKEFIAKFYDRYPQVFTYLQRMEYQAISQGYVQTILGRRRYFNFDSSDLTQLKGKPIQELEKIDINKLKMTNFERGQLRAAANAPIQGSSADLIKVAMVKLQQALQPYQAQILLQVHDELVMEMPQEEWQALQPLIETTMAQAIPLSVPLVVEAHPGPNWMSTK